MFIQTDKYKHVYSPIQPRIHICKHFFPTYTRIHIHTYIHTYIDIYIYIYISLFRRLRPSTGARKAGAAAKARTWLPAKGGTRNPKPLRG